ncbi:Zinc finger A20 and AN1 domain-containing stress-associated protein 9 [Toxocara canis]|uniref:Zinc finger A20 and AN1 domain-containing stress-associated protein 9 n=1 Tax=Toxocara canis TaxID=6265 RepID=A0A0B2V9C7_TOXCA|nr:Zinc finger A20 and AN1 domain-containing stress-associated protein 9 [Toxocara canis]
MRRSKPDPPNKDSTDHAHFTPGRSLMIEITVKSMMEGGEKVVVMVRKDATIRELKRACRGKIDLKCDQQSFMYDGRELRNDEAHLHEYGITHDCTVYLHPKMLSGIKDRNSGNNIILVMPSFFVNPDTLASLTPMIARRPQVADDKQPKFNAEKQIEHQLTRNRMKELMRRRKSLRRSQSSPPIGSSEQNSACSSICGSAARSPMGSEPGTPGTPRSGVTSLSNSSLMTTDVEMKDPLVVPVTEKELKGFFDPPETMQEMEFVRRDMYDPPESREELEKVSFQSCVGTVVSCIDTGIDEETTAAFASLCKGNDSCLCIPLHVSHKHEIWPTLKAAISLACFECRNVFGAESPMGSEPGTPGTPRSGVTSLSNSSLMTTDVEMKDPLVVPVTEKELKGFFDPPETMQEMEFVRRDMYDPPESREELEKAYRITSRAQVFGVKIGVNRASLESKSEFKHKLLQVQLNTKLSVRERIKSIGGSRCKVCHKRLRIAQRTIRCACDGAFCARHRNPETHQCSVDYKEQGRIRLLKENPKLEEGGVRAMVRFAPVTVIPKHTNARSTTKSRVASGFSKRTQSSKKAVCVRWCVLRPSP